MKRFKIILLVALILSLLVGGLVRVIHKEPFRPVLWPLASQPAGPYGRVFYGDDNAFQAGCLWLYTGFYTGPNSKRQIYLFDMEQRKITHELTNAGPICLNRDRSKLLCEQGWFMDYVGPWKIGDWFRRLARGRMNLFQTTNDFSTIWLIDTHIGTSRRVLELSAPRMTYFRWHASPSGNRVYSTTFDGNTFKEDASIIHTIDLETGNTRRFQPKGIVYGWWDEDQIVLKDAEANFLLWNVFTGKTNMLFSRVALQKFLSDNRLVGVPAEVTALTVRNGTTNDLYLVRHDGFAVRVERSDARLVLLTRHWDYGIKRANTINPSFTYLVDGGTSINSTQIGQSGVYLHHLATGITRPLLEPQPNVRFLLQSFYSDGSILYLRDYELWRMDGTGSNNTRLFPPAEK